MSILAGGLALSWSEAGAGVPLLFLHGFMGYGADWPHVFGEQSPAGYRLIAPDLPGHGDSEGQPGPYSFAAAADAIVDLLDYLSVERIPIVGLSGGGIVALHLAVRYPSRISRLVVISAPPRFPEQAKLIQRAFSDAMIPPEEQERMRQRHRRDGQIALLTEQTRAMADAGDPDFSREELARIEAETLIVFGDRDPLYPVSIAVDLRAAIPRSWLWIVPNGGHGPIFREFAPQFRATLLDFLSGRWS